MIAMWFCGTYLQLTPHLYSLKLTQETRNKLVSLVSDQPVDLTSHI